MELRILFGGLRRAFLLIVVLAVAGAAAGVALTGEAAGPTASTAVFLDPGQDFSGDPDRYVETEIAVLRSAPVATDAAVNVGGDWTAQAVLDAIDVTQRAGSNLVDVAAAAATEEEAVRVADSVAAAYLARHAASGSSDELARSAAAAQVVVDLEAELDAAIAALQGDQDVAGQARIEAIRDALGDARFEVQDAQAAVRDTDDDRTAVVEPAAPLVPAGRSKVLLPALGLLGGAGLGLLLGVARVLTAPRLQTRRQAEYLVGRPALAEIRSPSSLPNEHNSFASFESMESLDELARSLRTVAAAVASHPVRAEPRCVAVVDPEGSVGGHQVAAALASVFSDDHHRVALIPVGTWKVDGQEERVKTALARARSSSSNLPVVASGERGVDLGGWEAVYVARNRCIVTPWESNAGPLDARRLHDLREALEPHFDIIVLALPPVLDSPAAASAAGHADDAVLVVPVPDQDEAQLTRVLDLLDGPDGPGIHLVVARNGNLVRRR